ADDEQAVAVPHGDDPSAAGADGEVGGALAAPEGPQAGGGCPPGAVAPLRGLPRRQDEQGHEAGEDDDEPEGGPVADGAGHGGAGVDGLPGGGGVTGVGDEAAHDPGRLGQRVAGDPAVDQEGGQVPDEQRQR